MLNINAALAVKQDAICMQASCMPQQRVVSGLLLHAAPAGRNSPMWLVLPQSPIPTGALVDTPVISACMHAQEAHAYIQHMVPD
jgi:hypothetical protein